ncbi:glycerophosphoryl diester phosphodiesterase membrane domain-containing protein [Nocardiopsis potens]|uniref:glycerophosphoryl diester phosphodiesterase membrane domain-containing protein n=1 Tax=Nocardiopsis potens TaxID=1246458 RepID=UPI000346CABB|nr:glycerophosphoryl diester phosphodiesterase membrane domain-containing protein [Nocardiopsis potens]
MTHEDGRGAGRPEGGDRPEEERPAAGGWAAPGGGAPGPGAPRPSFAPPGQEAPQEPPAAQDPASGAPGWAAPGGAPGGAPRQEGAPQWQAAPQWQQQAWGPPPPPRPGIVSLRPLLLGDILNGAFGYIRGNPKTVLGLAAMLSAVIALLPSFGMGSLLNDIDRFDAQVASGASPGDAFPFSGGTLGLLAAGMLVQFVGAAVLSGVLATVIGMAVLGRRLGIREAFAAVAPRIGAVLGVAGLLALLGAAWMALAVGALFGGILIIAASPDSAPLGVGAILLGWTVLGLLAAWIYVRTSLAMPVTVLERIGPGRALARSWRLTRGSWWRVFLILLLTTLITSMVAQVVTVPFSVVGAVAMVLLEGTALAAILYGASIFLGSVLGGAITAPFASGVTGLLYVDLRMRREGLDLRLQAAAQEGREIGPEVYLAEPAPGAAAPGGPA